MARPWFEMPAGVHEDDDSLSLLEQHEAGLGATDIQSELLAVEQLCSEELDNHQQPCQPCDDMPMSGWILQGPALAQFGDHIVTAPPLTTNFGLDFLGCSASIEKYETFELMEHGVQAPGWTDNGGQASGILGEMSVQSDHARGHSGDPSMLSNCDWLSHARFDVTMHQDDPLIHDPPLDAVHPYASQHFASHDHADPAAREVLTLIPTSPTPWTGPPTLNPASPQASTLNLTAPAP